jgi:hypothetical protein
MRSKKRGRSATHVEVRMADKLQGARQTARKRLHFALKSLLGKGAPNVLEDYEIWDSIMSTVQVSKGNRCIRFKDAGSGRCTKNATVETVKMLALRAQLVLEKQFAYRDAFAVEQSKHITHDK